MQPWTEQWRDEGREEGLRLGAEQGIEKGRREGERAGKLKGERELFHRLLQTKFGSLDAAIDRRIHTADSEQLLAWSSRLFAATTIEDVFSQAEH